MSTKKDSYAACFVHRGDPLDTRLLHQHHVHPQGYGGEDTPENIIWLCESCHGLVHRLAHLIKSKKQGEAHDLAFQYQTGQNLSPSAKQRILELGNVVAVAMENFIPDIDDDDELSTDRVLVQLALPRSIHAAAKRLAANYTNPVSGRPMGIYRYLERVVMQHVRRVSNAPGLIHDPERFFVEDTHTLDQQPQTTEQDDVGGLLPIV